VPDDHQLPHRKTRRAYNTPGHVHFLTFSCVNRWPLLASDRSRTWCVDAIQRARLRNGFALYAWVIMPEHVHLLVRPEEGVAIEAVLRGVKQSVSRTAMNWLRANDPAWAERLCVRRPDGRTETRFWLPGGGYDRNITKPATLRRTVEYIHANPVRRGLVDSAIDWAWSSARSYSGESEPLLRMDPLPR
jgi:putative transposase